MLERWLNRLEHWLLFQAPKFNQIQHQQFAAIWNCSFRGSTAILWSFEELHEFVVQNCIQTRHLHKSHEIHGNFCFLTGSYQRPAIPLTCLKLFIELYWPWLHSSDTFLPNTYAEQMYKIASVVTAGWEQTRVITSDNTGQWQEKN